MNLQRAIVIGAGRSYYETTIIEEIAKSDFEGHIVLSDRIALHAISRGIDPEKFKVSVVTQEQDENSPHDFKYFYKYLPSNIKCHCCLDADQEFIEMIREKSTKYAINFFHRYESESRSKAGFSNPLILTAHNVGFTCWNIARQILGCQQIALLGLDFDPYIHDGDSNVKWIKELEYTQKGFDKYGSDIATFNLSPYEKTLNHKYILHCGLNQFLTNKFDSITNYRLTRNKEIEF